MAANDDVCAKFLNSEHHRLTIRPCDRRLSLIIGTPSAKFCGKGGPMSLRAILASLLLSPFVFAQVESSSSIRGLVTDSTGAVIPGTAVTIKNTATGEQRTATSDGSGFYAFPSLVPGTYDVSAAHTGFKRVDVRNRAVQSSASAQV